MSSNDAVKTEWQQQLEMFSSQFQQMLPPEIAPIIHEAIAEGVRSGMAERGIKQGAKAPDFVLPSAKGGQVSLSNLLAEGPVVLAFYRGVW